MPENDQLTALDATFLELEEADDGALMHIGAALVFASPPGAETPTIDAVREHLEQRLDLLPRYRQKLDMPRTGGLSWPSWERDERFEIAAHVRHAMLPPPGDQRDVGELDLRLLLAPAGPRPPAVGDGPARRPGG